MHRIDHETRAVDALGPGKDGFTGGDPSTQVAPTTVTPDWLNAVQEEIANAIALGNAPLAKADNGQLAAVIAALTAPEPDEPDAPAALVSRTVYVPLMDFRGTGWDLTADGANATSVSAKTRYAVPIPSGATLERAEAAALTDGLRLHVYRETYDPTGQASNAQGTRVSDTVQGAVWEVLQCNLSAAQDKSTSRLIIELEGAPIVGYANFGSVRWVRYTWRGYATQPD